MSEVMFSRVPLENSVSRIDAEYFRKNYLTEDALKAKYRNVYLGEFCFITDGQHGYHEVDERSEIRHLTAKNFKNWFANDVGAERLAKWVDDKNQRSSLKANDIVITTRGTVGCCAIVKEDVLPANIDQDVARICINANAEILPQYLVAYANSRFGQDWLKRNQTGMVQQGIALWRIREMSVPRLSDSIQKQISGIIEAGFNTIQQSKQTYTQAEEILLAEVGLQGFAPSSDPVNIKTFAESFATSGRLDAEYYQKKYEEVVARIKAQPHDRLGNLVTISKSIEPGSAHYAEEGLPFLRVADYSKYGTTEPQKYLSADFVKANEKTLAKLKPTQGTILFSKDGSVGTAYHLREDMNCITSGAVLHLKVRNEKQLIPEYLTLALNSKLVQMQAERDAGGSIILHWRVSEIENVVVPIIPYAKQQQIAALIEQSFTLKQQSEALLEVAMRAVEIAIEEDEAMALRYIDSNS